MTWKDLKEFCDSLDEQQLNTQVVINSIGQNKPIYASFTKEDLYNYDKGVCTVAQWKALDHWFRSELEGKAVNANSPIFGYKQQQ